MGLTITSSGGSNFFPEKPEIRRICLKVGMLWVLMFTKEKFSNETEKGYSRISIGSGPRTDLEINCMG